MPSEFLYSYDPVTQNLWRKSNNNKPELMGCIFKIKGWLTRQQKLKIIQANGQWVEV